jgi:predicted RNase H-like HicB family nuclease
MKIYSAVIERCPQTGLFVGFVPGFPGAHVQGETLDEVNQNLEDVISILLEDGMPLLEYQFVGAQKSLSLEPWGISPFSTPVRFSPFLSKLGFSKFRQRGSHKQFRVATGRCITVPFHQGRDISPI